MLARLIAAALGLAATAAFADGSNLELQLRWNLARFGPAAGRESLGVDMTLRLPATRALGAQPSTPWTLGNVVWIRNAKLGPQNGLVADVIRELERARGEMASIAEVGVRHELSHETTFSFGVGAGHGSPMAPHWRVVAGFEQSF